MTMLCVYVCGFIMLQYASTAAVTVMLTRCTVDNRIELTTAARYDAKRAEKKSLFNAANSKLQPFLLCNQAE